MAHDKGEAKDRTSSNLDYIRTIRKLRMWADHRDDLNEERVGKPPLDSALLRRAADQLEELSGLKVFVTKRPKKTKRTT